MVEVEVGVMLAVEEMMAEAALMGMAAAAAAAAAAVAGRGCRARRPPLLHSHQDAAPIR